jgi:transcriptional regulator with XRE-family HTH domain
LDQGDRLRRSREDTFLTVAELARKSGVSPDTISKIENGHRRGRGITIRKLAQALEVEPDRLLGEGRPHTSPLPPAEPSEARKDNQESLEDVLSEAHMVMDKLSRYARERRDVEIDSIAGIHYAVRRMYDLYSWLDSVSEERLLAFQVVLGTGVLLDDVLSRFEAERR